MAWLRERAGASRQRPGGAAGAADRPFARPHRRRRAQRRKVAAPLRGLLLLPRRDRDPAPLPAGVAALPDDQPGRRQGSPREPGAPAGARPPRRRRPSPLLLARSGAARAGPGGRPLPELTRLEAA